VLVLFRVLVTFWRRASAVSFGTRLHGVTSQKTAIIVNFVDGREQLISFSKVICLPTYSFIQNRDREMILVER